MISIIFIISIIMNMAMFAELPPTAKSSSKTSVPEMLAFPNRGSPLHPHPKFVVSVSSYSAQLSNCNLLERGKKKFLNDPAQMIWTRLISRGDAGVRPLF